ncbi:MAG: hypothetical protein GY934_17710, partial [Gammaproteobacteria bacterium]|nr:hypothetical protein [Gammaproteobacteria bacterium]
RTTPYNGGNVYTPILTDTGDITFSVGTVPVTLSDSATGLPFPYRTLTAYQKTSSGQLIWKKSGETDSSGQVQFDLEGLAEDQVFVIKTVSPFGDGKHFYSPLITHTGPVAMAIQQGDNQTLDRQPPLVSILTPVDGSQVSDTGFTLRGHASDDQTITEVSITISDAAAGTTQGIAQYNPIGGYWSYQVPAAAISTGSTFTAEVRAVDDSYNEGVASNQYQAIEDTQAPQLQVVSHQNGDKVLA